MSRDAKIILGIVFVCLLLGFGIGITNYNSIITAEEQVTTSYANIDTQLQRRADLIPNLINSVKGYMKHEKEIIDSITESRERLLNANNMQERAQANDDLTASLDQLNAIVENYPNLISSENFIQLQDELAGTENRIAVARRDYNQAVNAYNTKIKSFPGTVIANMLGLKKAAYFEAAPESGEVPNVDFE